MECRADRQKPSRTRTFVHALRQERRGPADYGISYEQYRDEVAQWSDEKLAGHLACREDNVRMNTMPVAMEAVLREAKRDLKNGGHRGVQDQEYARRNKILVGRPA